MMLIKIKMLRLWEHRRQQRDTTLEGLESATGDLLVLI